MSRFKATKSRVTLSDTALIALVNDYIQTYRKPNGEPSILRILAKLGWTHTQWTKFKAKAGKFLVMDHLPEYSVLETEETGSPEKVKQSLALRGINVDEIGRRVATAYGSLKADLQTLGLTKDEVEGALAMQTFGENRFANAMEVISSGVFSTAVKLQTQQRTIEERMTFVRAQIAEYGTMVSVERDNWVNEETKLVKQYALIGSLLAKIQETWYQGSAQLALVRMRMREDNNGNSDGGKDSGMFTKDKGKPKFRPSPPVILEQEPVNGGDLRIEPSES